MIKRREDYFNVEIALVEHCNIACAGCSRLAPLVPHSTPMLTLKEFEKDISRLSELLGGRLHWLRLLGGEPLLHPEVAKFCEVARKYFPIDLIRLESNGLLLPKMPKEFFETVRKNDITFVFRFHEEAGKRAGVTKNEIVSLCDKHCIKYESFDGMWDIEANAHKQEFVHYKYDVTGSQDPSEAHRLCKQPGNYPGLSHGKISPCTRPQQIEFFNKAFKTDLKTIEADFYDIHSKNANAEEMRAFMAKPIPFCKYCINTELCSELWKPSRKQIEEWT